MTTTLHTDTDTDTGAARPPADGSGPRHTAAAPRRRWHRPAYALLLVGTAVLYLQNIAISGWGNSFYAAAVQAGTQNWTALFFGSLDSGNAITVDKPPASLWIMALSGRLFGFSSWSMLAPQALMAVASVALLSAAVRRVAGPGAGLLAGLVLALTPVAVLMFRFNNPDAFLVLLLVLAGYCTVRALEKASWRWLLLTGLVLGFAFLAKMLQAFLVVPGFAFAYLWAAPTTIGKRIRDVLVAGVGIVVGAGWWLLAVALWPVDARPYIGGSTNNTPLELAFGYNGLGRIFGGEGNRGGGGFRGAERAFDRGAGGFPGGAEAAGGFPGAPGGDMPGGGPGGAMFGGGTGLGRLFSTSFGTQISWLLPAALILLVAALWFTRRAPRTDRMRGSLLLWGGWTVVTVLVFSFMSGTIHPYYSVALAPGIAALVALGGREVWRARDTWTGRGALAVTSAVTAVWAFVMLGWSPTFLPWLRWVILVVGLVAAAAVLIPAGRRRWGAAVAGAAVLAGIAAPTASAAVTAGTAHTGSIPSAGPAVEGAEGGFGGMRGAGARFGDRTDGRAAEGTQGAVPDGTHGGVLPDATAQGFPGGTFPGGTAPDATTQPGGGFGGPGGPGEESVDTELVRLLQNAGTRWAAATTGSQGAASMELASGASVMAMGGFIGADPYPTLPQFQQYVANGEIHYFVADGGMSGGPGGRGGVSSEITSWVEQHYTATTVGGHTVYDLTVPKA
ncbi:glycosyltransferase family 39 protein [Pseudonocardia kujensis]|uniref:ArnT family glycosyltransferase n=1 Tax=Pseudonocardia kujensis TaxID=1128675 RepID=UPI001E4960F5|nr:glycosyltransferase family 39 protein [Pseudonocardia kujensis]MCE0763390.1 glycosyltransferase family 39 protein [Pseudonocardia kujensis]